MFRVCHAFLPVHCSLVVTCWQRADLLALLFMMFYCVFVTFPCGVLGQVWCVIVSIPDLSLLSYLSYVLCIYVCKGNVVNISEAMPRLLNLYKT